MENIIFLQLLLNTTRMETNKTYNVIPKLQMPELFSNFMIEEDKQLLNLKEVIRAHKTLCGLHNFLVQNIENVLS